jgi:hypothetical protein
VGAAEPPLITLWPQRAVKEAVRSKGIPKRVFEGPAWRAAQPAVAAGRTGRSRLLSRPPLNGSIVSRTCLWLYGCSR